MASIIPSTKYKWNKDRLVIWQEGTCPYCGSRHITEKSVTRKIRAYPVPERGLEYSCDDCRSVNTFTRRVK